MIHQPCNTPKHPVAIEYSSRGGRVLKHFGEDHYAAGAFYRRQYRAGRQPAVRRVDERQPVKGTA